jgi:hypothetical protein
MAATCKPMIPLPLQFNFKGWKENGNQLIQNHLLMFQGKYPRGRCISKSKPVSLAVSVFKIK